LTAHILANLYFVCLELEERITIWVNMPNFDRSGFGCLDTI
jgi:hypothetical protein